MERDYAQKHVQIKEIPYRYLFMHKKHVRIKETPYRYPFMHKNMCELRKGKKLWTIR